MKKIQLMLTSCLLFSCDSPQTGQNTSYLTSFQNEKPDYDPNGYVNQAFGYSVPVISTLRLKPLAATNGLAFVDAQSESTSDIIMIIPFTETLEEMAQQLQMVGTPYRLENGAITFEVQQPGVSNIAGTYAKSPYDQGGIGIIRIISGAATIQTSAISDLFKGIKFYPPQSSLEERKAFLHADVQKQKQSNEDDRWLGYFRDQMGVSPF